MIIKFRDSTLASIQKKFTAESLKAYMETENVSRFLLLLVFFFSVIHRACILFFFFFF